MVATGPNQLPGLPSDRRANSSRTFPTVPNGYGLHPENRQPAGNLRSRFPAARCGIMGAGFRLATKEKTMRTRRVILIQGLLLALAGRIAAQSTFATLTGTVTDPTGAAVPGASIEAIFLRANYSYKSVSNESGVYVLGQLPDGTYVVHVRSAGLKEFVVRDFNSARGTCAAWMCDWRLVPSRLRLRSRAGPR